MATCRWPSDSAESVTRRGGNRILKPSLHDEPLPPPAFLLTILGSRRLWPGSGRLTPYNQGVLKKEETEQKIDR
jgi:hypothetical protein